MNVQIGKNDVEGIIVRNLGHRHSISADRLLVWHASYLLSYSYGMPRICCRTRMACHVFAVVLVWHALYLLSYSYGMPRTRLVLVCITYSMYVMPRIRCRTHMACLVFTVVLVWHASYSSRTRLVLVCITYSMYEGI